jgi:hypothetical protein
MKVINSTNDPSAASTEPQAAALAGRLHALRRSLWRTALGYPPLVAAICALAREVLPASACPVLALDAMTIAARGLRRRARLAHGAQYERSREALSGALAGADVDGRVADLVLADLLAIAAGEQRGLSMQCKPPSRGSLAFLRYVHGVRREYQALWSA